MKEEKRPGMIPSTPSIPFAQAMPMQDPIIVVNGQSAPFALASSAVAPVNPEYVPPTMGFHTAGAAESQLEAHGVAHLKEQGYSNGLIHAMAELKRDVAKQIWVVDDSGSMMTCDGNVLVEDVNRDNCQFVKCSRWEELQECVGAHIKLSGALQLPTSFRLLNSKERGLGVCLSGGSNVHQDVQHCLDVVSRSTPNGSTPLKRHIFEIRHEVEAMMPVLEASGKRVAIVICTDGMPTDATHEEFLDELRKFRDLPVFIVVRLCTDEMGIVKYYNELDAELEFSIDVIDDFRGEALEVALMNPWLNYGMPLHRVREMGMKDRVMDLLDERPLSKRECKQVCSILFGEEEMFQAPDTSFDWNAFVGHVTSLQRKERHQWDPITETMKPWIDFSRSGKAKVRMAKRIKLGRNSLFGCFGWQ